MTYLRCKSLIPKYNFESKSQCILIKKTILHLKLLIHEVSFLSRRMCPFTLHISVIMTVC